MGRTVDGTSSLWRLTLEVCRLVRRFGTGAVADKLSPELATALEAVMIACMVLQATDDFVLLVDRTAPAGPEDQVGP